jgi:hypothetical protein
MWHSGNNYGQTACAGVTTLYSDDVSLHSDGTPNEPKYTQLSRLHHLIADYGEVLVSQDSTRLSIPWWDGKEWRNDSQFFVYSYLPSIHFICNQINFPFVVLFRNQNISMSGRSVQKYDNNMILLWNSANYSDIASNNNEIIPVVVGPLQWQIWSELVLSDLPKITSLNPIEQLIITDDDTVYLWYRRNVTLKQASAKAIIRVQTRIANALLFFLNGQFLGEFDNRAHTTGPVEAFIAVDLSHFKPNQPYLFEILSLTIGVYSGVGANYFEQKGIAGNVWLDGQLLSNNETNLWEHQKRFSW